MCDIYPNYKPSDISETIDVWCMMLEEYTYEQSSAALKSYILSDTSGFAPSIGQLVEKIYSITKPQELNEMEAWALVSKAIRNSGYNSVEEYSKLPELVQRAVGLPGQLRTWALDEDYNEQVVSSNFIKCYRNEVLRHREFLKMPNEVKKLIQNTTQGSYLAQIEDSRERAMKTLSDRKESEIKALETKLEGVPMPEKLKEQYKELFGEKWEEEFPGGEPLT